MGDWIVKVDVDAVFLPSRLRTYLEKMEVTDNGIYLENCKYVNYGFFGSLAVMSHEKDTGNQAWGEDLFQQRCMDLHGVDKVGAYDINTDASCAAWRPEGEKKNRNR